MKKYIVTGGAGFIGSHLVDKIIENGNKAVVIDNLSTGKKQNLNPKADFFQLDICNFEKIKPLFSGADGVFHLAAIASVPFSVENPLLTTKVNVSGTVNVFKSASENKVKRVVFASSSSVYGDQGQLPLKEKMVPNPKSPYALQKLVGEQFAIMFKDLYKMPIVCLRYFNVYGPRIDFNSDYSLVLGKFLKLKSENKPLTIFGTGEQTRGFCYVSDVVSSTIMAMESEKIMGGEVINISHKKSYSVNYLARLIGGKIQHLPQRQGDVLHTKADIALAKKLLGWEPKVNFSEGVEATKKWFPKINRQKL